jgi:hypothetical protein
LVLRGSSQLKAGAEAEAKLRLAHGLKGAMVLEVLAHDLRIGRNIVVCVTKYELALVEVREKRDRRRLFEGNNSVEER